MLFVTFHAELHRFNNQATDSNPQILNQLNVDTTQLQAFPVVKATTMPNETRYSSRISIFDSATLPTPAVAIENITTSTPPSYT